MVECSAAPNTCRAATQSLASSASTKPATTLIEHGAPAKGIAGRLGHASVNITEQVYMHNTATLQDRTEQIFEATLRRQKDDDVDKM